MFPYSECDRFEPKVDRHEDYPKKETHTVPVKMPYAIELDELPQDNSLAVAGMIEVPYLPTKENQFYVNYATATVYFHPTAKGLTLECKYAAVGSVFRASDVNEIYDTLYKVQREVYWMLTGAIASCKLEALDPPSTSVNLRKGTYYIYARVPIMTEQQVIEFAVGEFQISAIPANNYLPLLITLDDTGSLCIIEGTPSQTREKATFKFTTQLAAIHYNKMYVAQVVVQDDGSSQPGTIKPVKQDDITDLRQAMFAGNRPQRCVATFRAGDAVLKIIDSSGKYREIGCQDDAVIAVQPSGVSPIMPTYRFTEDGYLQLRQDDSSPWKYCGVKSDKLACGDARPAKGYAITNDNELLIWDGDKNLYRLISIVDGEPRIL